MPGEDQKAPENQAPESQAPAEKPTIKDPEKVLSALEAVRKENDEYKKQLNEFKQNQVDSKEYERLKALEEQIKDSKRRAEEEKLKQNNNWEELTARKLSELEAKYQTQIQSLNQNLTTTQKDLQQQSEERKKLDNLVNEYTRRQKAFDAYIVNGGKREYFENVWKGEIRDRTMLDENNNVRITKAQGSTDIERDEIGEPLDMDHWMVRYRSNGGGIFFAPTSTAAGSGVSPASPASKPAPNSNVVYISKKDVGSQKFMMDLKQKLNKDPLLAIASGEVIVREN